MPRTLIVGDTVYTVDKFFRQGAAAFRSGASYHANPYRPGSGRHDQWALGHVLGVFLENSPHKL
jgi:hypothetical protein